MKTAIVTGAFGFAGANLVEELLENEYKVYAMGRPGSPHSRRFEDIDTDNLTRLFLDMDEFDRIPKILGDDLSGKEISFFHLAWAGNNSNKSLQEKSKRGAENALKAAGILVDKGFDVRFIATGSQAEYGAQKGVITEETSALPITEYGRAKLAACDKLFKSAPDLGVEIIWCRLFSLIGKYEPRGRMLPDLVKNIESNIHVELSSCRQYWDYLDAKDAAKALRLLAERGKSGRIYNVASGSPRPLKEYVTEAVEVLGGDMRVLSFGDDPEPFISLKPDTARLSEDTGFWPSVSFADSVVKLK